MEVIGETPPPLPPKTKKPIQLFISQENDSKKSDFRIVHDEPPQNGFEVCSLKIVNHRHRDEDGFSPPQIVQVVDGKSTTVTPQLFKPLVDGKVFESVVPKTESDFSEPKNDAPKIITWAESKKKVEDGPPSENVYQNVSNGEITYENALKVSRKSDEPKNTDGLEKNHKKKKTPKIEVRQEDHKTVVKISIKDTPTPEEEMNAKNYFQKFGDNIYENGYQNSNGGFAFPVSDVAYANCDIRSNVGVIYENANMSAKDEPCYENLSNGCYENVEENSREHYYANVNEAYGRGPKKELITEANYSNLNGDDLKCDRVYKNCEFQVSKNNAVSIISQNSKPPAVSATEREDKIDDSYENVQSDRRIYANENPSAGKCDETAENIESRKKGKAETDTKPSVVEAFLQKPATAVKSEKSDVEFVDMANADDGSLGDPFDSGTCSDVDSLPTFVQSKRGNVIVTIKTLQSEDKGEDLKKSELGHRRAESLTSSGVGVDSEESDDDKSNISCDSLNSNEPYARSNSEDHGYHTPNSEDKTGSPVEYENAIKRNVPEFKTKEYCCEKPNIVHQVADVSRKIRNLQTDNNGVYLAKLVESTDFEDYENVSAFENTPKVFKKKPPPPPPPTKPSFAALQKFSEQMLSGEEEQKSLPKNLLQDIRSRNVRLSSTYPNGEIPEGVKSSANAPEVKVYGKVSATVKKLKSASENDPKRLMVEERTYEERKTDVRSVKTNKICAMEVDTDKFYKFHLAENVREGGKEGDNGNEDETFAGLKDYLSREKPAAITSAKGTIRGVKNRVKAGIATFLQLHENKSYKDRDAGKVVVYTTTMGIVRETYHKCLKVKQILRTLMVKFEERDVFMSSEAQDEIRDRMKCDVILVPQVFVEGQHIGDAETIERLNEMGELRTILKPYKSADACSTCKVCGGYRLLPCSVCKGSKKSIHRNHFTAEFVSLKCMNCDQVGLTKCHAC